MFGVVVMVSIRISIYCKRCSLYRFNKPPHSIISTEKIHHFEKTSNQHIFNSIFNEFSFFQPSLHITQLLRIYGSLLNLDLLRRKLFLSSAWNTKTRGGEHAKVITMMSHEIHGKLVVCSTVPLSTTGHHLGIPRTNAINAGKVSMSWQFWRY